MRAGTSRALGVLASACLCTLWITTFSTPARADVYSESAVKAAYLYHFTAYVDWPTSLPTFAIAVLNDDEVAENLAALLSSRSIKDLPPRVRRIKKLNELGDAQLLYIGPDYKGDLHKAIARINKYPVLIVTSQPGALDDGSAINFLHVDSRIRFEVSIAAVQRSGLNIAPELLDVAFNVEGNRTRHESNCRITKTPQELNTYCQPENRP